MLECLEIHVWPTFFHAWTLTCGKHNGRGETLARVLAKLGVDDSLRGSGDASDQAEEDTENGILEKRHVLFFTG